MKQRVVAGLLVAGLLTIGLSGCFASKTITVPGNATSDCHIISTPGVLP